MKSWFEIATSYLDVGLKVFPVSAESKAPKVGKGVDWKGEQFVRDDLVKQTAFTHFSSTDKDLGIGVICGEPSGNLYVFDFDNHFGDALSIFNDYRSLVDVDEVLKNRCCIAKTKSGGFHIYVRTAVVKPTEKLARRWNDQRNAPDATIEAKAHGGYVVAPPTRGYEIIDGSFADLTHITEAQFDVLYQAALSFNEYVPENEKAPMPYVAGSEEKPGDIYNRMSESVIDAKTALVHAGWTPDRTATYWTRPGKKRGVSATFGKVASGWFYNFSSSSPVFDDRKAYTCFQVVALLNFNGDFKECTKWICERYGIKTGRNEGKKRVFSEARRYIKAGNDFCDVEITKLAGDIGEKPETVKAWIEEANAKYADEQGFDLKSDIDKAEFYIKKHYKIRFDVISKIPEMSKNGELWEKLNIDTIYRDFQHNKIKFSLDKLKSLLKSNFVEQYNPFEEYFQNLPEWDGIDHIKKLASYIKADDQAYFEQMFEKALVRNIACALDDTYYNRIVVTFVSEQQNIGKSYFFKFLNPFKHKYYTDEPLKDNKDSRFALTENFIYSLEELDSLSKFEVGRLKATISASGVKERVPYAANKEWFPRCCSFWGSTNKRDFLTDDKNTRWLCFYIHSIDWKGYSKNIDINKVWAQAWHLYNTEGYEFDLSQEEATKRDIINEEYKVEDFESSIIKKFFMPSPNTFMTNAEIMLEIGKIAEGKIRLTTTSQKIGRVLSELGYERFRQGGIRGWLITLRRTPIGNSTSDDLTLYPNDDNEDLPF